MYTKVHLTFLRSGKLPVILCTLIKLPESTARKKEMAGAWRGLASHMERIRCMGEDSVPGLIRSEYIRYTCEDAMMTPIPMCN